MSRKRAKTRADGKVVGFRMPEDMLGNVRTLAERMRLSDADIMRMAIDRGLTALERVLDDVKQAA